VRLTGIPPLPLQAVAAGGVGSIVRVMTDRKNSMKVELLVTHLLSIGHESNILCVFVLHCSTYIYA